MNDDGTTNGDEAANNEPGLTRKNTEMIRGEGQLAEDDTSLEESNIESLGDNAGTRMAITDGEDG